jgi:hypothetical protein
MGLGGDTLPLSTNPLLNQPVHAERFLSGMSRLDEHREQKGKSMFALFPLRYSDVP